jgi:hypothetical protein
MRTVTVREAAEEEAGVATEAGSTATRRVLEAPEADFTVISSSSPSLLPVPIVAVSCRRRFVPVAAPRSDTTTAAARHGLLLLLLLAAVAHGAVEVMGGGGGGRGGSAAAAVAAANVEKEAGSDGAAEAARRA